MKFEEIYKIVGNVPFISKENGRFIYDLILKDKLTAENTDIRAQICRGGGRLAEYLTSQELWNRAVSWYRKVAGQTA